MKKENNDPESNSPILRLVAVVVVFFLIFLAFQTLPATSATTLSVICIILLPLVMAGITHKSMKGETFSSMYSSGLKSIPLLNKLIKEEDS